jgi:hypothetical protein
VFFQQVRTRNDRSVTAGFGFKVKQNDSFDWGGDFTHADTVGSTGFAVHPLLRQLAVILFCRSKRPGRGAINRAPAMFHHPS